MTINKLLAAVADTKARSAWDKGVKFYATDLLLELEEAVKAGWQDEDVTESPKLLHKALLNGANDWSHYSWSGCSLIYNEDIARRLCTPSELKRTDNGRKDPNANEQWLDTQARALYQACWLIERIAFN